MTLDYILGYLIGLGMILLTGKPLMRGLEQATNEIAPNNILDLGSLAEAVRRGIATPEQLSDTALKMGISNDNAQILLLLASKLLGVGDVITSLYRGTMTNEEAVAYMKKLGIPANDASYLISNYEARLTPGNMITAEWRNVALGASIGSAQQELLASGWTQDRVDVLRQISLQVANVDQLIQFAAWDVDNPNTIAKLGLDQGMPSDFLQNAAKTGIPADLARQIWASHWQPPQIFILHTLFQTGQISEDDMQQLFQVAQMPPGFGPKIIKAFYKYPSQADIIAFLQNGIIAESDIDGLLGNTGLSPDYIPLLHKYIVAKAAAPGVIEKNTVTEQKDQIKGLTSGSAITSFEDGLITEDQLRTYLKDLGQVPDVIDLNVSLAKYKMEKALLSSQIAEIGDMLKAGDIDVTAARAQLGQLNVPAAKIEHEIYLWTKGTSTKAKMPSLAELGDFLKAGVIQLSDYISQLQTIGYSDQYIEWYVNYFAAKNPGVITPAATTTT